jgi:hypothetical protein
MRIDRKNKITPRDLAPSYLRNRTETPSADSHRITILRHLSSSEWVCLQLPAALIQTYLPTIKNIRGRRWNDWQMV